MTQVQQSSAASTEASTESKVLDIVRRNAPIVEDLEITGYQPKFLDGSLYSVSYKPPGMQGSTWITYVYVHDEKMDFFQSVGELLKVVGATHEPLWYRLIPDPRVVTSFIALAITLMICFSTAVALLANEPVDLPEFLTSGFLLILGFYFGKSVAPGAKG